MKRGFKKWFLFLFLLICSFPVFAAFESLSLHLGESREIDGVNFTLLRTNKAEDKVVMCVNNKKVIVSDQLTVDASIIKLRDVFAAAANLEIDVACKDKCKCGEECSNEACSVSGALCSKDDDCDDSNNDTSDFCISGVCENRPVQLKPCVSDPECDDKNPCTTDQCNKILKKCIHIDVENCSLPPEQPPQQQPAEKRSIPLAELSAYMLAGVVVLLLIAVIVKKLVK